MIVTCPFGHENRVPESPRRTGSYRCCIPDCRTRLEVPETAPPLRRGFRLEAVGLSVTGKNPETGETRLWLDNVSVVIPEGKFVGIIGGNSAGKSTLIRCLSGNLEFKGSVYVDGTDLRDCRDGYGSQSGYLLQRPTVHLGLSARSALEYAARLRLPPDTSRAGVLERVKKVLEDTKLSLDEASQPIGSLSGGKQKCVCVGIELIGEPRILFLDELQNELDAEIGRVLMELARRRSDEGTTVICVTHNFEHINLFHYVLVLCQGRVIYYGPPSGLTSYFEVHDPRQVIESIKRQSCDWWSQKYQRDCPTPDILRPTLDGRRPNTKTTTADTHKDGLAAPSVNVWSQTRVLVRRYAELMLRDRNNLIYLLGPLAVGLLIGFVLDNSQDGPLQIKLQAILFLVMASTLIGCLSAAREIVKEEDIYARERFVAVRNGPYLASKLIVLAILSLIQSVVLLFAFSFLIQLSGSDGNRLGLLFLTNMVAVAMGLTMSALVTRTDRVAAGKQSDGTTKVMVLVAIVFMAELVFSDVAVPLRNLAEGIARSLMVSLWSVDLMKTTLSPAIQADLPPMLFRRPEL